MAERYDTIIVGGGISGLAALHAASKRDEHVLLFERSDRPGGSIHTVIPPWGGTVELGPNTLRGGGGPLSDLIDEIGLSDSIEESDPSARNRFILRNGSPVQVPTGPRSAIESPLFSLKGKLRVLTEPFRGRSSSDQEESVADFVRRRFGREVLDWAVDPFVSGIYAGDPERLSLQETFPLLAELEKEAGSVVRGMIRRRKQKRREEKEGRSVSKPRRRPFSFAGGLSALPNRLAELHRASIKFNQSVEKVARDNDAWMVTTADGVFRSSRLILATEAGVTANLLRSLDPNTADLLRSIRSSPVGVLQLLYKRSAFPSGPPAGFGMLIPSREERAILGVIYTSSIYPARVPDDKALLTIFIGGVKNRSVLEKSDSDLLAVATGELKDFYHVIDQPIHHLVHRWNPGIPQHNVGHRQIIAGIESLEKRYPGMLLIGSYRGGVSVPDCVESGLRTGVLSYAQRSLPLSNLIHQVRSNAQHPPRLV